MPRHDPLSLVGTTLGDKYRLDAVLGAGGFGAVYRGQHLLLDVPVAVKIAFRVDGALGKRFRREARTLMRLRHPCIVRMYDYGSDPEGHVYMVQEFVSGRPLGEVLAEHGPLPAEAVIAIAVQALGALEAAHAQGIIHRDVKPANLMLQATLDAPRVQLLDFGIAKMKESGDVDQSELTRTGGSPGTPAYMAPEQIQGLAEPASDLYALGATMFRLLTGERPYPHPVPQIYISHMQAPVPELPETVPAPLAAIVRRSMAKSPAERFPDARAMADALRAVAGGDLVSLESMSSMPSIPVIPTDTFAVDEHAATLAPPTLSQSSGPAPDFEEGSTSLEGRGAIEVRVTERPSRTARAVALASAALVAALVGIWLWQGASAPSGMTPVATAGLVIDAAVVAGPDAQPPDAAADPVADAVVDAAVDAAVDAVVDAAPRPRRAARRVRRAPRPPKPVQPEAKRPAPPEPDPTAASREAVQAAERDLRDCRCEAVPARLEALRRTDALAAARLQRMYTKKCVVVGLPGACR